MSHSREHRITSFTRLTHFAVTAAALMFAGCSPDAATGVSAAPPRTVRADVVALDAALYDQDPPTVDGLFSILVPVRFADDFVVPAGQLWRVTGIRVAGSTGFTPVLSDFGMQLVIRRDQGGLPGDEVVGFTATPTSSVHDATFANADHFLFDLPAPMHLAAGKYWLELNQNKLTLSWVLPTTGAGSMAWVNGAWTPFALLSYVDLAFAINGTTETASSVTISLRTTLAGFGLAGGIANSFDVKLQAALAAINAADTSAACDAMRDFISHASALSGKKMTTAQATTLINEATLIRSAVGC